MLDFLLVPIVQTVQTEPYDPIDDMPRRIVVFAGEYPAGSSTGLHRHRGGQLLHASIGLMRLSTAPGHWFVPSGHAVWIPPDVPHDVTMHGDVSMRTAYVAADSTAGLPGVCQVISVSPLLRAGILALADEPDLYDETGRGASDIC